MGSNTNRTDRIREIFCEAQNLPTGDERAAYLEQACHDDTTIKNEVLSLLGVSETHNEFLRHDASGSTFFEMSDLSGSQIGNYRLTKLIGEGGFGEVYRAEQIEPFQRNVALKIIKMGMDTQRIISRFKMERQALARMNHPNIAQVYDAGTTESGRPYFVMELVHGIPLQAYCDDRLLTIRERVALLRQVCAGIQHAHKKGILHRDLKPSNILVSEEDGKPMPKIIDFGVAMSLQNQPKGHQSQQEMIIGTPLYMSPELLEQPGSEVDERSDIYSLGIILYELATGVTPLEHHTPTSLSMPEMRDALLNKEMPRPSKRYSTLGRKRAVIARRRHTGIWMLKQRLKGDMDRMTTKAIDINPEKRYEDVLSFDEDLARYLKNEPVKAGNPRIPRRIKKFTRRHKPGFLATVSALATLIIGTAIMAYSLRHMKEGRTQRLNELAEQPKEDSPGATTNSVVREFTAPAGTDRPQSNEP